jgi:hypothetical protein
MAPGYDERFAEFLFLRLVRRLCEVPAAMRSYLESTSSVERIEYAREARAFAAPVIATTCGSLRY